MLLLASIQELESDYFSIGIKIEYHTVSDFFALDHGRIGKAHIQRVGFGIIGCLHRGDPSGQWPQTV